MPSHARSFLLLFAAFAGGIAVHATNTAHAAHTSKSDIPRQASLRSSRVNMHVGPGKQYPVEWVFVCKNLPVVIISEFGQWRRVETSDKTTGWIHKSLLSNEKTLITINDAVLYAKPSKKSQKKAKVLCGCPVKEKKSNKKWVKVQVKPGEKAKITGWMKRKNFWVYAKPR